jgi:hypothetical protein
MAWRILKLWVEDAVSKHGGYFFLFKLNSMPHYIVILHAWRVLVNIMNNCGQQLVQNHLKGEGVTEETIKKQNFLPLSLTDRE